MKKSTELILYITGIVILAVSAVYLGVCVHYNNRFFPGTRINGIDVSGKDVAKAETMVSEEVSDYTLTLKLKNGQEEEIEGSQIDFAYVSGGEVQSLKDSQNSFFWLGALFDPPSYMLDVQTAYDADMLRTVLESLECFDEANVTASQDAQITETDTGYEIVPETEGNELDADKTYELVKAVVDVAETEADLEEGGCYVEPAVKSDDELLVAKAEKLNKYFNEVITYNVGNTQVTLDYSTIREWMTMDDELNVEFSSEMVAEWIAALSDEYDTWDTEIEFTTSLGETITVKHENYGWRIDEESETEALLEILANAGSQERTPEYLETAMAYGENGNDIGDTYVEIDYVNQRMWFYKDGELLADTPIVSGSVNDDNASPEGIFCILDKEENVSVESEDYDTAVDYWMLFGDGVGIHDSKWRTSYGGKIYRKKGSNGCINTPWEQAKIIYENISVGVPVICYTDATDQHEGKTYIEQPTE